MELSCVGEGRRCQACGNTDPRHVVCGPTCIEACERNWKRLELLQLELGTFVFCPICGNGNAQGHEVDCAFAGCWPKPILSERGAA